MLRSLAFRALSRGLALSAAAAALCGLAGCAAPPQSDSRLLHDEAFAPVRITPASEVFALSDEMRALLRAYAEKRPAQAPEPRRALIELLYAGGRVRIDYDASVTRTAAETYAASAGNCLSLVIMTSAFAKALDLPVFYQRVLIDEVWSRIGTMHVASGHVNLAMERPAAHGSLVPNQAAGTLVVDFLPQAEWKLNAPRVEVIDEATVLAMFMNNRAAEALAGDRLDEAYAYAREALRQDARLPAAFNTLGVVYLRRGLAAEAAQVFAAALQWDPDNPKVLHNQVQALTRAGRTAEAYATARHLAQVQPVAPLQWFELGLQAMRSHEYDRARELFGRELQRDPDFHEARFWLAQAELAAGHRGEAEQQLALALAAAPNKIDRLRYAGKLEHLRAAGRRAE